MQALAHDDRFPQNTPDETWLGEAGAQGWVVLTKDKAIRRNVLERTRILEAGVACFMLGRGDLSAPKMAEAFIAARRRIERALRRYDVPLAASVTLDGGVTVLLAAGEILNPARTLK